MKKLAIIFLLAAVAAEAQDLSTEVVVDRTVAVDLPKAMPMGDTDKLVDYALKVAREKEYFTELPSSEYETLNVEAHD